MDSLRLLETLALAEEHYGVEIDTRKIETIATVGDIIAALSP
jgi:acyl carrier protein